MSPLAAAFDRAAKYDAHASVQASVARWLAEHLAAEPLPPRVLEVGCGTGFVRAALDRPVADWLATDIAPAMLARAAARLARVPGVRFAALDGEHPALPGEAPFGLVTGSLAVQWFGDLAGGLARLFDRVEPGGRLAVTTLAAGTFAEWRAAHGHAAAGVRDYPDAGALAALRMGGQAPALTLRRFTERHADGRFFLRGLKAIGAATPRPGHRPLAPGTLRTVMQAFEAAGAVATYEVALLEWRRPGAGR